MNKVIKFCATWCGPCQAMKPHFEKFQESVKNEDVEVLDLDVDEHHEEAANYGVRSIPFTIFIKDNKVTDSYRGSVTTTKLLETFNRVYKN